MKTVKVLFSLVLVCLFAVQFAGAMPASASADRVDSKWDNVQLDTSVYVYGDDGAVKQDGDFGVKAGFSGADASGGWGPASPRSASSLTATTR